MPLSQYKRNELYRHVESFELADPKMFEDAVITENLCVCEVKKNKVNKFSWNDLMMTSWNRNYILVYEWNIRNSKGLHLHSSHGKPSTYFNIDTDFVETTRCSSIASGAGFGKGGLGYLYNIEYRTSNTWKSHIGYIRFPNRKAKTNFASFWYSSKKGVSLASKLCLGMNLAEMSSECFYWIPQIDWEKISDHPLWKKGMYDEAVLDTMGLKWNEDKTCILEKR